jgi:hypothetical protein
MPSDLTCPVCRGTLRLAEPALGQRVRCDGCRSLLTVAPVLVPAVAAAVSPTDISPLAQRWDSPPPAPEPPGDEPVPKPIPPSIALTTNWNPVLHGLGWINAGVLAGLVLLLCNGTVTVLYAEPPQPHEQHFLEWWSALSQVLGLLVWGCVLAGRAFCCAVPPATGAQGRAAWATLCTGVAALCLLFADLGSVLGQWEGRPSETTMALAVLGGLGGVVSGLTGEILFLLFLRRLGSCLRSREVVEDVNGFFNLVGVLLVLVIAGSVGLVVVLDAFRAREPEMVPGHLRALAAGIVRALALVSLCLTTILLVGYGRLVRRTRQAIIQRLPGAELAVGPV